MVDNLKEIPDPRLSSLGLKKRKIQKREKINRK